MRVLGILLADMVLISMSERAIVVWWLRRGDLEGSSRFDISSILLELS